MVQVRDSFANAEAARIQRSNVTVTHASAWSLLVPTTSKIPLTTPIDTSLLASETSLEQPRKRSCTKLSLLMCATNGKSDARDVLH